MGRRRLFETFRTLRAAVGTVAVALALPVLLVVGLAAIPLGDRLSGRRRLGYEFGRIIMRICWWITGIRIEEIGRARIQPFRPRVYMANHASFLDMPPILTLLPGVNGTLIKKEAFRVPLIGAAFRAVGFLPVDRKSPGAARESLELAVDAVRRGHSLVIAPEGTRSRTGKMGPFKTGGFRIAVAAGAPIAPVTVTGARELLPPGAKLIRPGVIRVRFHDPVSTEGIEVRDRRALGELMEQVRRTIAGGAGGATVNGVAEA